ncbi:MAG: iron-containing alcohol dehydrogenase [Pseudomonadales bacterium]
MIVVQRFFYRAKSTLLKLALALVPRSKPMLLLGPDSSRRLCQTIAQSGFRKVLIVTDKPLIELGLIEPLYAELRESGVDAVIFDGVEPDPSDIIVTAGTTLARQAVCDAVLAVGGGSSIDAAKIISVSANSDTDPLRKQLPIMRSGLALFAVPTTAGTGSEVTVGAVITDSSTHTKRGLGGPGLVPMAAALDPLLMQNLPPHITAATGMDALTHAIEAYIGTWNSSETDKYALAAARLIFNNLPRAFQHGDDLQAREAMAIASSYAGFAINATFVGYTHAIAHQLGAQYGVPHGLANAVVLPHVLAFSKEAAAARMAQLARFAGLGNDDDSDQLLAQKLIDRVIELSRLLGIPEQLAQVKAVDFPRLIRAALKEGAGYPVPIYLDAADCDDILNKVAMA